MREKVLSRRSDAEATTTRRRWPLRKRLLLSALRMVASEAAVVSLPLLLLCSLSCSLCYCKHDHYRRRCSFCSSSPHVDSVRVATATQIVVACSVGRKPLFSLPSKRTQTLCLLDLLLLFIVILHHCHHQLQIHCYQNTKSVLQIPLNKNYFVHVFSCFFFDN